MFAFTFHGAQYTWCRLPQGFCESPSIYAQIIHQDLNSLTLPGGSTLIQYADDLLLASKTQEDCRQDSLMLLSHLANKGHKASLSKLQFCLPAVNYLGHVLSEGTRRLSPKRVAMLKATPPPHNKHEMLSFLGMAGYCRHWVPDYRLYDSVLQICTSHQAPQTVSWTLAMKAAFVALKTALSTAPALGLPDYTLPFHPHVSEKEGFALGLLTQQHGSNYRPVALFISITTNS